MISTGVSVTVPSGTYADTLRAKDCSALDTTVVDEKTYAKGVGLVYVEHVVGPAEKIELVTVGNS